MEYMTFLNPLPFIAHLRLLLLRRFVFTSIRGYRALPSGLFALFFTFLFFLCCLQNIQLCLKFWRVQTKRCVSIREVSSSFHIYMELGPEDVSLLERCPPHFSGIMSMELGPNEVSLLERCPAQFSGICTHFNGVGS